MNFVKDMLKLRSGLKLEGVLADQVTSWDVSLGCHPGKGMGEDWVEVAAARLT
jgi:hypothetical protein